MRIVKNSDEEIVRIIENALNVMVEKYGKPYCPCAITRSEDTICMCKEFREQDYPGECHCGRFIKVDD